LKPRARPKRIGFPVALKIRSRDILHKTEVGGVALDLQNRHAVQAAAEALTASVRAAQPSARIEGFLVQEMVDGVETIVGARSDPFYGPLLLIGSAACWSSSSTTQLTSASGQLRGRGHDD